jgi:hypothetical protein
LIWDERFVKDLKETEPADYTAVKPQTVAWVDPDDIKEVSTRKSYVDCITNEYNPLYRTLSTTFLTTFSV